MNTPTASSNPPAVPRRDFLKTSAGLALGSALGAAPAVSAAVRKRSVGANDRIRIGVIGCGSRGRDAHMVGLHPHQDSMNFEIVAICDSWRVSREKAGAMVKQWWGREPRQFVNYQELLAMEGIDAVTIGTPDHHHTTHLEAAAKAGKHIYVEKPLAMEMDRLVRAVDAVKAAGTVVQVGTQNRSNANVVGARKLYQSGLLGKASRIEECRNAERPYWYQHYKPEVKEEDVDWKVFLGDRPMEKFRADKYSAWYGYYHFSQGSVPQLGAHFIDMVHFVTGATFPESCMCHGGNFTWKDEHQFTNVDSVQATWVYPEGFLVSSSNNMGNSFGNSKKFYCEKGVLKMDKGTTFTFSAEGGPRRDGKIRGDNPVPLIEVPDHYLNWLQCMRTGGTPVAPIDAGYQHAVAVLMAVKSFETGRKTTYDHKQRIIRTA